MENLALLDGYQGKKGKYLVYGFTWRKAAEDEEARYPNGHPKFYPQNVVLFDCQNLNLMPVAVEVVQKAIDTGDLQPWRPQNFEKTFNPLHGLKPWE